MDLTAVGDARLLDYEPFKKGLAVFQTGRQSSHPQSQGQGTKQSRAEVERSDRKAASILLGNKGMKLTLQRWLNLMLKEHPSVGGGFKGSQSSLETDTETALMCLVYFDDLVSKRRSTNLDAPTTSGVVGAVRGRKDSQKSLESNAFQKDLGSRRDNRSLKRVRSMEQASLPTSGEKKSRLSRSIHPPASDRMAKSLEAMLNHPTYGQHKEGKKIQGPLKVEPDQGPVIKVEQIMGTSKLFNRPGILPQALQLSREHREPSHVVKLETETEMTLWQDSDLDFLKAERRPALPRFPPIWAATRQEVCESFEFFKSYQGGVYFSGNAVKGYLLSGFPAKRDIFAHDGKLIISHGGGGSASGQTRTGEDTDQRTGDKSVRALLNNYKTKTPLVLLIDERYSAFPFSLASKGVTYAVLGLYVISHAWAEYQLALNSPDGRVVRWKFAFRWYPYQDAPWWLEPGSKVRNPEVDPENSDEVLTQACVSCLQSSPAVYQQGWFCLNPECVRFWLDDKGKPYVSQHLTYDPSFLRPRYIPDYKLSAKYTDLRPPPPAQKNDARVSVVYEFSRGWHCRKCGRLTCRYKWQHWECGNSECKAIFKVRHTIRTEKDLRDIRIKFTGSLHAQTDILGTTSYIVRTGAKLLLLDNNKNVGSYQTYILPEQRGKIHHIIANPGANRDVEADEIFKKYQEQAASGEIAFQRWPLRAHKLRTPLLTNYFSQNCGEPYQYVGGSANTVPFDKAPSAVVRAREYMQIRVNKVLENQNIEFNEVLSAAYMERQKMAFHSDAERGLGPVVAGVSFGSPAFMHFRLLKQHVHEGESKENALSVILKHGDVLVMEGADIQKYYEHCVSPANFRISATGRTISPQHSTRVKAEYRETNLAKR